MGIHHSKHIDISHIPDTVSRKEFILKRKLHYRNEFGLAKTTLQSIENETIISSNEKNPVGPKRPTFLEPPSLHNELDKELFRKHSIRSEIDEFTYAKERLTRKKIKSHIDKSHIDKSLNMDNKKRSRRIKNRSCKRNKSHEPTEGKNDNSLINK